ncbi:2-amino-4-hydroxy-6-hydroxymethyldihydropteridine diphosphokinase [Prochlorococcus marinus]|uniref:2-amino-4-hydroxy-6- hydroxymethyldihydropteridine diphosphokinase n=1 Tax=Prochlorococcus marinus TaxID=1219 RepID=UPI0022B448C7|nr:2-amino-4-hydroxy-6-hydroxymethyldihydropteridine diphosphokinase [Prochlorococcus marinus]
MSSINYSKPRAIAIGLGANIKSPIGPPILTLIKARPLIEQALTQWIKSLNQVTKNNLSKSSSLNFKWSPLYKTHPIGGPSKQPAFINAALMICGKDLSKISPSELAAKNLLKRLAEIEKIFGRDRKALEIHWGPRSLDLDLLAWGDLQINTPELILPHPRLIERDFVLIPLSEALNKGENKPQRIPPQKGWSE